ncbi:unnamed protein product [[Candida] boidinii]|nr:unnamed protein product [[Candida] boidinii]
MTSLRSDLPIATTSNNANTSTNTSTAQTQIQSHSQTPVMAAPITTTASSSSNIASLARSFSNTDLHTLGPSDYPIPLHFKKSRPNSPSLNQPLGLSKSPSNYNKESSNALHLLGFGSSITPNFLHSSMSSNNLLHQTPDATPLQTPSVSPKLGPSNPTIQQNQIPSMQNLPSNPISSSSQLPPLRSLKLDLPNAVDMGSVSANANANSNNNNNNNNNSTTNRYS